MILFFHFICLLAHYIVSNISKSFKKGKTLPQEDNNDYALKHATQYLNCIAPKKSTIYESGTLKFFPPVYVQRYETVALILQEAAAKMSIKKVVDIGCAELGFLMYLKKIEGVTEILEVDIDTETLQKNLFKAAPLTVDYLMGRRKQPLDIYVLAGSIADYDDYLIGCDALIAIEVIEHLTEKDFEKMPFNVFHKIKPKLVIFTTPNADFNVLFPNFTDMRHKDHKFEWTRKEFFDWTQSIVNLYPEYSLKFYGIGAGPDGTENLGCCSQMVVFYRKDGSDLFLSAREEPGGIHNYRLIQHYRYPAYTDNRSIEEKILHEIEYQTPYFSNLDNFYNYETNESEIPITLLKEFVSNLCSNEEELITILRKNAKTLRKRGSAWFLVCTEHDSSSSDTASRNEDWLNDEISESFYDREELFEDNWSSDGEPTYPDSISYQDPKGLLGDLSPQRLQNQCSLPKSDCLT